MDERFARTERLLGSAAIEKLAHSRVMIFGLGGVGGYVLEGLARAGVGFFTLADSDTVSLSNLNRQILATEATVGRLKTEVAAQRVAQINPAAAVHTVAAFMDEGNIPDLLAADRPDYIVDAIDTVKSKISIIKFAAEYNIPVISCMGTGNKMCPEMLSISDISKTDTCPLARVVRRELRLLGIAHVPVLWSREKPLQPRMGADAAEARTPASAPFVPSVAGMMIAAHVTKSLLGDLI